MNRPRSTDPADVEKFVAAGGGWCRHRDSWFRIERGRVVAGAACDKCQKAALKGCERAGN